MVSRLNQSKFQPPVTPEGQVVQRKRLLKRAVHRLGAKRLVFIEAQAGQGKTTFARQLLKYQEKEFSWYRIEPEDNDPLYLATGLLECLKSAFPTFDGALLEKIFAEGGAESHEIIRILGILLAPLRHFGKASRAIVFDDCHLLDPDGLCTALLQGFVSGLPSTINAILISRSAIFAGDAALRKSAAVLGNDFLEFQSDEATELFMDVFELSLSPVEVGKALKATGGWAMGLAMAGYGLADNRASLQTFADADSVGDYFAANVAQGLTPEEWTDLMRLGLLDDFSIPLAQRALKCPDPAGFVGMLEKRNYFLRRLGNDGKSYEFHHLFLDFLRRRAQGELGPGHAGEVLRSASRWCVEREEYEKALVYEIRRGDLDGAEELLREVGGRLYAENRLVLIHSMLQETDPAQMAARGWLAFFTGLSIYGVDPYRATELLESAALRFRETGETAWELAAVAHVLFCHCMITFNFRQGRPCLDRLTELLAAKPQALPPENQVFIYNAAALGNHFIKTDGRASFEMSNKALGLARETGKPNLEALAMVGGILCRLNPDHLLDCRTLMNRARTLMADRRLGNFNKLTLRFLFTHYCFISGHWENWRHFRAQILNSQESYLLPHGVFGAFLLLEDIEFALLNGKFKEAAALCGTLLEKEMPGGGKHFKSQALGALALALALDGRAAEARGAIAKSLALREETGGDAFIVFQHIYAGAAYAALKDWDSAADHLETALGYSDRFLGSYIRAAVQCQLVLVAQGRGDAADARRHALEFLNALATMPARNIIALHPGALPALSEAAALGGSRAAYLTPIGHQFGRSVTREGGLVTTMRVQALGGLSFAWGKNVFSMEEMTGTQRQLLAHLISAPGFKMEKEALSAKLWPDSPRDKAIASFDMTLSRLRKAIDQHLGDNFSKKYLVIKNGVVGFENCLIDVDSFETAADQGLKLTQGEKVWEGANKLREAECAWAGELLGGLDLPDECYHRRAQLGSLYETTALKLASLYVEEGFPTLAAQAAQKGLRSRPGSALLNRALHDALVFAQDLTGARAVLESYAEFLRNAGFSASEINSQLAEFTKAP